MIWPTCADLANLNRSCRPNMISLILNDLAILYRSYAYENELADQNDLTILT